MSDFCAVSKKCDSCQLSNLSYEKQLAYKENRCRRLMKGLCRVEAITPSPKTRGYRNKAQFVFKKSKDGRLLSGIYQSADRTAVATDRCALCTDGANEVAAALRKLFHSFKIRPYDPFTGSGWLRSVVIRENAGGEMMVIINGADMIFPGKRSFVTALQKACPAVVTAVIAENRSADKLFIGKKTETLFGEGTLTDTLCGKRFVLSPSSFYQVNRDQTEQLYKKAIEWMGLSGSETVLDAYCGIGTIGIIAAEHAKEVRSVELNPAAIRDAERNARLNGIENIRFIAADSRDYAAEMAQNGEQIDAAFIDPPRAGCTASFLKSLARLAPRRIVYISCNPETQARDIRLLSRFGYRAEACCPFDMFPHTNHIETVVLMTKK